MEQPVLWPLLLLVVTLSVLSPPVQSSGGPLVGLSSVWESSLSSLVRTEAETVRRMEDLLTTALEDSTRINEYLNDWRTLGFDAVVAEDSPAHYLQLAKQRPLLKYPSGKSSGFLARIGLSVQAATDRWNAMRHDKQAEKIERGGERKKKRGLQHPIDAYLGYKRMVESHMQLSYSLTAFADEISAILAAEEESREDLASDGVSLANMRVALLHRQQVSQLTAIALTSRSSAADERQADSPTDNRNETTCADNEVKHSTVAGGASDWCLGVWDALELSRVAMELGYKHQAREWMQQARLLLGASGSAEASHSSQDEVSPHQDNSDDNNNKENVLRKSRESFSNIHTEL